MATPNSSPVDTARIRRFAALLAPLVLGLASTSGHAQPQGMARSIFPEAQRGEAAIDMLGNNLEQCAADHDVAPEELVRQLLRDSTLWVNGEQRLFVVDTARPKEPEQTPTPPSEGGIPTEDAFTLHSNPGANHTVYLDFTGHHSVNNAWGHDIVFPPFNISGSSDNFSQSELLTIIEQWRYVAEDFAPFEVDVTTEEPPLADLRNTGGSDERWGIRCLMTQTTNGFGAGTGGIALLNTFDDRQDNPVFVFNKGDNNGSMTASHEVGHALGLFHDGLFTAEYHPGSGSGSSSWGPIMGAPFGRTLVQWSNGDYTGATSNQNDVAVITSSTNGVLVKADDHGNNGAGSSPLPLSCPDPATTVFSGVIETRQDLDAFKFHTSGGLVTIQADPHFPGPNLDILLKLQDNSGALITEADPSNDPTATISMNLAAGTYVIVIDGIDNLPTNSGYGSLGTYNIAVTTQDNSSFYDIGRGLAGTGGSIPLLTGSGFACNGDPLNLDLSGAPANSGALLIYGFDALNAPFKGGTLVPNFTGGNGGILALATNGNGDLPIISGWPDTISSVEVFWQYWLPDPGGPQGYAASNALRFLAPIQ